MKQFTFSAQVANNLLTVLQGYSKTIRLLLVMFLTLTVTTNAWGAEYELVSFSDIKTNDVIIIVGTKSGTAYAMKNTGTPPTPIKVTISNSKITSTATDITFTATNNGDNTITFVSTTSGTLYCTNDNNGVKIGSKTGNDTKFSFDSSVNRLKNIGKTRWLGIYNTQDWRCYTSASATNISGTTTTFYRKVTAAASYTITATSNNNSYGTVSVSGTTITATPNAGYRVISGDAGYNVTYGTADVTNNGDNTFSVTPSSDCTITINFEAIPTYTVTWNVNGEVYETTQVTEGSKPTFPATPSSCDATSNTFYGWTTATWDGKIDNISEKTIYTSANNMPAVNGAVTYYAVFATKGAGGGAAFDGTSGGDFKIYALVEGEKKYLKGTGSKISPVDEAEATEYTFTKSDGVFSIKTGTTYLTYASSTNLGTSNSSYSWKISEGTKGSWRIASAANSSRGIVYRAASYNQFGGYATTNITADGTEYYDVEIGGGASVSYSGYITSCTTEPSYSVTATLSHVTANGENPTTITSEAEDLTLTYSAESGWNLPDAISVTMGGNQLMLNDEYTWDKETGNVWILPASGFTGNIVVTINGWKQLAVPTELNFANITSSGATLSWSAVANASSYTVSVYGEHDEVIAEYPGLTEITKTVSDLDPETNYVFGVVAVGDGITYTNSIQAVSDVFTTSAAASPATITLSQLGVTSTIDTYSVGDQYTLPTTSSQSCDGKQLVGWSTVEVVAETDTKPTSNYYELGAEVTLAATQTFYAVFAAGSGGGGEGWTAVTSTSDLEAGATYAISNAATEGTYLSTWDGGNNFPGSTSIICPLILGGSSAGAWTFQIADGGTYNNRFLTATNTTEKNYLKAVTTADDYSVFTISFDAINKNAVITCKGKASRNILRYNANSGSPIFACYTSGQSATYLQKYATGGGGYTAYSTSCIPTYSITYDFAGGDGGHCTDTRVEGGSDYTICDEAPTKEGNTFLHWSDGVNTYNPNDVIATVTTNITLTAVWQPNTYTVTWSNNGEPDEETYEHGESLVVPTAPASCDGVKEFVGWTTHSGYYHATTAPDDIFTTKTTPVTAPATYYAVFATPPGTGGGGGGSETTIDDVLTRETTGITDSTTTYSAWSGKKVTSSAIYAGNSAGGNNAIQLRSNNSNSGIVTTTSGGKATRVEVEWQSATTTDRKLDIYGRNVAYSAATELYSTSTQGTKLGSITCGTSTELEITGDYEYIGLRSNSGAMYLASVTITWSSAGGSSSYTDYTTICQEVTGIAISGSYPTAFVQYDSFSFAGGIVTATFENGSTQDVTSLATFSGYNMDEVGVQTVTVTYMGQTAKYEITINQSDRWRLTWNVSGKTNTGASPIYVQKGSAIGTLPVPEVPAACAGKTFMGWTESNIVPSDGKGIVYITEATVPTKNTTYYAVFATINNFSTQAAIEDIEDGSKVVIVAVASMDASGGAGQAISSRTISITSKGVIGLSGDEVSIFDETINTPHSTCIWTLTKEGGGIVFEQGGKYIRAVDGGYRRLLLETTKDYWTLSPVTGKDKTYHMQSGNTSHYIEWFDHTDSKYDEGERYIGFVPYTEANDNGDFDMQFYVTANADGNADITDYTTGCAEYTITYYGFHGGYSTSCSSDGTIVLPVNSLHTIPNCGDVVTDHTNLGREFLNVWMTQPHGGHTFKPGDTFILTQDTTLYAQWKMETTSDVTTLPTDIEDLAGTDIYVYGGTTLNIQPGTTTINSLTLKGGLQADGSYKMPTVWVPEGATLVRNSNKINLDLIVNAQTYYPFAVPFAAKNNENVEYLDPVLAAASTYGTHFAIKTYDGARRADVGEDKANNWVRVLRGETLQPGVGYIITALTYPTEDTATIRIPMSVSNTWFKNGEQAAVNTTVRNTIAVTAHAGAAATEHQRHAGWNFVANPYLTSFAGGNVANDGGLDYINGELIIQGSYEYLGEDVPYVTVPAYDFAYYSQHKLSDVKLSPEWSFFVQVGTGGTMNFTTAGRQQAPASIAARNAEERPVKMDVDLILSDNHSSDQTGIIICDRYSDAYEIGRDLEKLFGSAYNLSVYTLMEDNTPLAFQALAIRSSMQVIPVGYRAPEQGEYTFHLNEATSSIDLLNEQYEQLVLVDYQTGELTNLLYTDYTFYSERTQSNSRFAIYAVPRQNAPTDLPNAIGSDEEVRKVIYNDRLYILRDGNVYNGMGQKM